MPKKSGKDKGSLTQKADSQQVRISQVSNVSKAVSAMGNKTSREINETERRISSGGDSKVIASSMNSVLGSLKNTVDSLQRGVETATLGTAKAAQDAIKQYGQAISEDFKINRQNMVASALASSTPIFGYFASKFMETSMFKSAKDKMAAGLSSLFKRKGKEHDGMGMGGSGAAEAAKRAKADAANRKQDTVDAFKIADSDRHKKYEEPAQDQLLTSLSAIQGVLGAQIGKFDQWYSKFLLEHPYFKTMMTTFKAMGAAAGMGWKAAYFFWKPRGGYRRQLSKSKKPLDAINQNIATLFLNQTPRLDALMIYTKATAMAVRDMSTHITGIKYPMMDASKLGGTWSLAGGTMSVVRAIGRGLMKGARKLNKSLFMEGSQASDIFEGAIGGAETLGKITDYTLTGPGRAKDWVKKNTLGRLGGAKENERLFGGLGATGAIEPIPVKISTDTKEYKSLTVYQKKEKKKKEKYDQKLLGYTATSSKMLEKHDKREKGKRIWRFLGFIGSGLMTVVSTLLSSLGSLLSNPYAWVAGALAVVGTIIVKWFHKNVTPGLQKWVDKQMEKSRKGGEKHLATRGDSREAAAGNIYKRMEVGNKAIIRNSGRGGISNEDLPVVMQNFQGAFIEGQMEIFLENQPIYQEFTVKEIEGFRAAYKKRWKKISTVESALGWMTGFGMQAVKEGTYEGAKSAGREFEKGFVSYLKDKIDDLHDSPEKLMVRKKALSAKYGQENVEALGRKGMSMGEIEAQLEFEKNEKQAEASKKSKEEENGFSLKRAREWANKNGGHYADYVGKTLNQAKEIAKRYGASFKEKTTQAATLTADKLKELAVKYNVDPSKFDGMTLDQAMTYAKSLQEKAKETASEAKDKAKEVGSGVSGWLSNKWGQAKSWWGSDEPKNLLDKATVAGSDIKDKIVSSGSLYTDILLTRAGLVDDNGNPLLGPALAEELKKWPVQGLQNLENMGLTGALKYAQNSVSTVTDKLENMAPNRKAWIKRNADRLYANGIMTAEELQKLGIQIKDTVSETGEKVGGAVMSTAVSTTQNINNAVNSMTNGGGGGSNKFLQESTMDQIAMGDVGF